MYFSKLKELNDELGLNELSMGMSHDYIKSIKRNLPTEIPLPKPNPKSRVGGFV